MNNTQAATAAATAATAATDADALLSSKYQQKTDKQHILDNPDTYIGSTEEVDSVLWILNETSDKIVENSIKYIPGLFKLFDEGIVNCRDHVIRMLQSVADGVENAIPVSNIDISIADDGTITMYNDGNGIDVAMHPEYNLWIPELIFGHLRTSTNYDKTEKKIVGGKNGFGFKLVLIWSVMGAVETVDHIRGLKYRQEFKENLDIICPPTITKCKTKPYTRITFKPDYARLGIAGLTPDIVALFKKRVYDVAAVTDKSLKVRYNTELVPVKNFQQYIDFYIGADKALTPRVYEESGCRWEYAVSLTPSGEFAQVSFVNGIHTAKGGKHVEYILSQITRKICDLIEKKKKVRVNAASIKEQLILFLRCDIENPSFDSQTKDFMNTPFSKFGSKCEVSDRFIEKISKLGIVETALQLSEIKDTREAKKTDGSKSKNVFGIPKLADANWAGTAKSKHCIIIFCEGDSAKAGIISGLSSEDRNIIGVYPMKGKILNVRGETSSKVHGNKEISDIKQILGLETGKSYDTEEIVWAKLRYGKVMFMTDQDLDGSHIKGLAINLFQSEWATLLRIPQFISFMNTPILKATRGKVELNFFNEGEYRLWKASLDHHCNGWSLKYYKGLGTSTAKEFREYFKQKKIVYFKHSDDTDDLIDMVFNKKRADHRKDWLNLYNRGLFVDTSKDQITYNEFINHEMIHFSKYDCDRSIPNLMDGLKISLRKILFSAFKKNLIKEIKVAQFAGYTSEHSGYHHGEASLNAAIIGMAQTFVGSNNINLLLPNGQFGTRLMGGKDSASERYIFTALNKLTRTIFPACDDHVLTYLEDDGLLVEPIFYAPIIPMVLVNGTRGIGTGFSTDILCYNPEQIIQCMQYKLAHPEFVAAESSGIDFIPFYDGFTGVILKISPEKFMSKGVYEKLGTDKIQVTELPIGFWTESFKEHLDALLNPSAAPATASAAASAAAAKQKENPWIVDFKNMCTDQSISFIITFAPGKLAELESIVGDNGCNGLEKLLNLYNTMSTTNMHLFDEHDALQKYAKVTDIADAYFEVRLKLYQLRKNFLVGALEKELVMLSNKVNYIKELLEGTIDLRRKSHDQVVTLLKSKGYDMLCNKGVGAVTSVVDEVEETATATATASPSSSSSFKYLTKLPMDAVTEENIEKLMADKSQKDAELETLKRTDAREMWRSDLCILVAEYAEYKEARRLLRAGGDVTVTDVTAPAPATKKRSTGTVQTTLTGKKPRQVVTVL